jgi:hypothetical protein
MSTPSPFANLVSHKNTAALSTDFVEKWVVPFYLKIGKEDERNSVEAIKKIKHEITENICLSLLGDLNWRSRVVGSYFATVKGYDELTDIIGTHLLKSEVCCVGHIYAVTFAFLNTNKTVRFLNQFLDYYLTKPGLGYDHKWVMGALLYLDKVNGTHHIKRHMENWIIFQQKRNASQSQIALTTDYFDSQVTILRELSNV